MDKKHGTVVTFYSFKGGVGRSMALANIAVLLARAGKKVLCVDWDLEAPGLDHYLRSVPRAQPTQKPILSEPQKPGGLLAILQSARLEQKLAWRDYICTREAVAQKSRVDFIGSGDDVPGYSTRLADFSWPAYFDKQGGGEIIETLRQQWKAAYDYVLVDSRTGLTDSSGVCTIQLPDVLILLFAANQQSIDWCERVAKGIREGRQALPYDRAYLPIIPVLGRFDASEESDRAADCKNRIAERFEPYFRDWIPRDIAVREMLNWCVLPYMPRYSFDEALAVEDEPASGALGLSFYYYFLARLLLSHFQDVRAILASVGVPGAALPPLLPSAAELRIELQRDSMAVIRYREAILSRVEENPQDALDALETLAQAVRPAEAESLLAEAIRLTQNPAIAKAMEEPRLLILRAVALAQSGRSGEAEQLYRKAIERAKILYGKKAPVTAQAKAAYAEYLQQEERETEAENYYAAAVNIYDAYETNEPAALQATLAAWRDILEKLGKWEQMLEVAKRVVQLLETDTATNAAKLAKALDRCATAFQYCGQYDKAVEYFRQALDIEERIAETPDSPSISNALNNLAEALREKGCYIEAEKLFRRALHIDEITLEKEHPNLAIAYNNLAEILRVTGRYSEAEEMYLRVLKIEKKILGEEHPNVAAVYNNLAAVLREMNRCIEAEELFRQALRIYETALGSEHPHVATFCVGLANVLRDMNRYDEAEKFFCRALRIYKTALGDDHPYVGVVLVYLAQCLSEAGNQAQTQTLWQQGLAKLLKSFGNTHDRYGRALWHYAEHQERGGQIAEARESIEQAVAVLEQSLGTDHPDTQDAQAMATRLGV
ncbi:MAG: tetratricopeptide repeat protein [Gammaproteobacteria bacterium]